MWELADELRKLSGKSTDDDAFTYFEIVPDAEGPFRLQIDRDWWPSGAETYALVFSVVAGNGESLQFIWKSYISIGSSLSGRVDELMQRRHHVESIGIAVPRLVFRNKADVCEEFIAMSLGEAAQESVAAKMAIQHAANETIETLLAAGYRPQSLHDARSRGNDCVLIDFGTDLGGSGKETAYTSRDVALLARGALGKQ